MGLGYDGPLYILAFDHRGSFQKKFFGISGEPDAEETFLEPEEESSDVSGIIDAPVDDPDEKSS